MDCKEYRQRQRAGRRTLQILEERALNARAATGSNKKSEEKESLVVEPAAEVRAHKETKESGAPEAEAEPKEEKQTEAALQPESLHLEEAAVTTGAKQGSGLAASSSGVATSNTMESSGSQPAAGQGPMRRKRGRRLVATSIGTTWHMPSKNRKSCAFPQCEDQDVSEVMFGMLPVDFFC